MMKQWPTWTPEDLKEWCIKLKGQESRVKFYTKLATDPRMREFWEWHSGVYQKPPDDRWLLWGSARDIAVKASRAVWLPGKPGDMTSTQRNAYFEKVRKHAYALMDLLTDTRFDRDRMFELKDSELEEPLENKLVSWGDDEEPDGHIVAFCVDPDGKHEMPYDYPESHLMDTLSDLAMWTYWDDGWDGSVFGSSAPINNAKGPNKQTVYFTRTVYSELQRYIAMPFDMLAVLTNVALELPADQMVDGDTVRKQVRRYDAPEMERVRMNFDDPPF